MPGILKTVKNLRKTSAMETIDNILEKERFYPLIVLEEKENLKMSFFALGPTNLKAWLPRILLSLLGFR